MKTKAAFEFTVRKMLKEGAKLYFWTFTFRDVHSLKDAMGRWNAFLTLLKRKLGFRGVRVLELHDEHGCHLHVVTDKRFKIRKMLDLSERYGFGRIHVTPVFDVAKGIKYLCKYLAKARPACLKGSRLWSAFGDVARTRVKDIVTDMPFCRLLRRIMGRPSVEDELNGIEPPTTRAAGMVEKHFLRAVEKAWVAYFASFDPDYEKRQAMWAQRRSAGLCQMSARWLGPHPVYDQM